jgi:hypothetical protein
MSDGREYALIPAASMMRGITEAGDAASSSNENDASAYAAP